MKECAYHPVRMVKIKDGFVGQRLVVCPFYVMEQALSNPLTSDLVVHSMGYFPKAMGHYIDRPHGCGEYILIYCVKGKGFFVLEGREHAVVEGQFFILPAEVPHHYWADEAAPWYIYWIHFKGKKAPFIYEKLSGVNEISVNDLSRIKDRIIFFDELLNIMEAEMTESSVCYVNMSVHHIFSTFLYIDEYRKAKHSTEKAANTSFISLATHFMHENVDKNLTLDDMAAHSGYSKSYFYRLFYKETGYAPGFYFQNVRMKRAAELLLNTSLKVTQVALKLGFDDPYYCSRLFKKIVGVPPAVYKKNVKNGRG